MSVKEKSIEAENQVRQKKIRPQTIAWFVIIIAFAIFCTLVYLTINFVSDYLSRSTKNLPAEIQVRNATVYIIRAGQNTSFLAKESDRIEAGDSVIVSQGQAILELFDGSRLEINPSTKVQLRESKVLTTNFVRKEKKLSLEIGYGSSEPGAGKVTVIPGNVNNTDYVGSPLEANTEDGASLILDKAGRYVIELQRFNDNSSRTLINSPTTNLNKIEVTAAGRNQTLEPGKRVIVDSGQPPSEPTGQQDELILNNRAFINGLDSWTRQQRDFGNLDNIACSIFPDSEKIDDGTIYRVHTVRQGNSKDSYECSLRQDLNLDVSRFQNLVFSVKLKIISQSLSGGGEQGIEFPIFIKIDYIDTNGNANQYFAGFYIVPFDSKENTQVARYIVSEQIKQGDWKEFVSEDLMARRSKPQKIVSIQVGSGGHDYEAFFTDLSLVGKG